MPAIKQNIDLVGQTVPFNSSLRASGVYVSAQDQDNSKPKVLFIENLMPIKEGFASVTPRPSFATFPFEIEGNASQVNIHIVYNQSNQITYLLEDFGKIYLYIALRGEWKLLYSAADSSLQYSVFFLKGTTHVFHKEMGLFKIGENFGDTSPDWVEVVIPALGDFDPTSTVIAMTSALSYLIAVTHNEVYWSDPIDETQFDPTADTSLAGATKVLALRGEVQLVLPITDGFVIYTNVNAISATYSQNPNNPFIFQEVANSTGAFSQSHVTYKSSLPAHFIWGDHGLMQLSPEGAQVIFPELTDFLGGDIIEYFSPEDNSIRKVKGVEISTKLTYLNSRFVAISYGEFGEDYSFILLFDLVLNRWGKIRIDHKAVFNLLPPHATGGVTFQDAENEGIIYTDWNEVRFVDVLAKLSEGTFNVGNIGVLGSDGKLRAVDWLDEKGRGEGVILFGELAVSRARISSLNEVELYGELPFTELEVFVRSTNYNKVWKKMIYVPSFEWFVANTYGKTHELLVKGKMQLTAVVNKLSYAGME